MKNTDLEILNIHKYEKSKIRTFIKERTPLFDTETDKFIVDKMGRQVWEVKNRPYFKPVYVEEYLVAINGTSVWRNEPEMVKEFGRKVLRNALQAYRSKMKLKEDENVED